MIKDEYKQFLLERAHADKVKHSGRTLFEHLCGTHDLLQQWGNSKPVCAAGLFHSIYGTKSFRHKAWPLTDRATIANLIGDEAELLAYIFCTADRKTFLISILPGLREIEAANLLDQSSRSSSRLKQLRDSDISVGAKYAINRYLSRETAEAAIDG
jgi:hypothetical protein